MLPVNRCFATAVAGLALMLPVAREASAMSGYRWKKRPLVVFAAGDGDVALVRQRAIVATDRSGMAERDMVIVWVVGKSVTADGAGGPGLSADAMRRRYGVGTTAFRALLVGKDGGVKISSGAPLSSATLFATIDAMPMRRDEMRRR